MNGKIFGLYTIMTRMRKQRTCVNYRRLGCLCLTFFLLLTLPGCKSDTSAPEFPPAVETVQAAAEELLWTLDPEGTQSWAENQILYSFQTGDQSSASVSCALVDGKRVLMLHYFSMLLPDKPQFAWEDCKDAVTLAEKLYGGFSEGELYQALSGQNIPEPVIPQGGPDTPTGQETLNWKVELPSGYVMARWSISAGTVKQSFPSPVIRDWRITFSVSLYESKAAYESMVAVH